MDTVLLPVPATEEKRLDLLNRQDFVDRLQEIAFILSRNKKNACYAINGGWGVGKSFVLDMFEEQAKLIGQEGFTLSRYLVFHYNCWEYDYYEEPLIAIVASMLDEIDENVSLLSQETKGKIIEVLKVVGKGLLKKAIEVVDEKTGIPLAQVAEVIKEGSANADDKADKEQAFDQYISFKKTLKKLRSTIALLAEEQTVVFVVDELDRCLPEYTIKVLERLHHLFDNIPNVQVILSIDKGQLEHTVRQIYGENTDVEKYLRKFIDFELKLDAGTIKDNFYVKFEHYVKNFENLYEGTRAIDVDEFNTLAMEGLDTRNRIAIIEKCQLLHNLIRENEIMDSSYMCLEILLVIIKDCKIDFSLANRRFNIDALFKPSNIYGNDSLKIVPQGLEKLAERYKANRCPISGQKIFSQNAGDCYINATSLWGVLLGVYRNLLGFEKDVWHNGEYDRAEYTNYSKKYWELLQIIN